jgi:hypothetical protein
MEGLRAWQEAQILLEGCCVVPPRCRSPHLFIKYMTRESVTAPFGGPLRPKGRTNDEPIRLIAESAISVC